MHQKKAQSNFKKAMNELLGEGAEKDTKKKEEPVAVKKESEQMPSSKKEAIAVKKAEEQEKTGNREEAIIPSGMVVSGNIHTTSNIQILGSVIGDVECEGDVLLLGQVQGNLCTKNLTVRQGKLTGDVEVKEHLIVDRESVLTGNVTAKSVYANAHIEGQIKADGLVDLKEKALVEGDIFAGEFSVMSGAKIKGMVTISET